MRKRQCCFRMLRLLLLIFFFPTLKLQYVCYKLANSPLFCRREQHTSALIVDTYTSCPSLSKSSLMTTVVLNAMHQRSDLQGMMRKPGRLSVALCLLLQ
uniref:Secreted protein n=1 Tax=Arundo donax TaxID=35708 RepID=A0A0A9G734_ARUDO